MPKNKKRSIYYPCKEGNTGKYYANLVIQLSGAIGAKYGISNETKGKLAAHKSAIPQLIKTAFESKMKSKADTKAKQLGLKLAKQDMLRELQRITRLENFEDNDAEKMGIRVFHEATDLNKLKPKVTGITVLPQKIEIDWLKRGMQGVVVSGSYDGSDYSELDKDLRSPWEDFRKNREPGQPETRWYKLRYMKDDKPVGLESDVVKAVAEIY